MYVLKFEHIFETSKYFYSKSSQKHNLAIYNFMSSLWLILINHNCLENLAVGNMQNIIYVYDKNDYYRNYYSNFHTFQTLLV